MSPAALYIAFDADMVIVATVPLEIAGGKAYEHRWGSVVEISPADPMPGDALTPLRGVGLALIFFGAPMGFFMPWWWGLALLGLAVVGGTAAYGWLQRPGVLSAPRLESERDRHHVLIDPADQELFSEAVEVARRASQTWPALGELIDVTIAERLLAQALFALAGALERRQELREIRDELAGHADTAELDARHARAVAAVRALDAEIAGRQANLSATAVAGERFIRDREIGQLARDVDSALDRLTATEAPAALDAAAELAAHTEAVLRAYRELDARYGR